MESAFIFKRYIIISLLNFYVYRFQVTSPGTHFWHAHTGMQRADGVNGAFVVRATRKTEVMSYYDEDLPEHTIIIQDWLDQFTASKFILHHHSMGDNTPSSILINGMFLEKKEVQHINGYWHVISKIKM